MHPIWLHDCMVPILSIQFQSHPRPTVGVEWGFTRRRGLYLPREASICRHDMNQLVGDGGGDWGRRWRGGWARRYIPHGLYAEECRLQVFHSNCTIKHSYGRPHRHCQFFPSHKILSREVKKWDDNYIWSHINNKACFAKGVIFLYLSR